MYMSSSEFIAVLSQYNISKSGYISRNLVSSQISSLERRDPVFLCVLLYVAAHDLLQNEFLIFFKCDLFRTIGFPQFAHVVCLVPLFSDKALPKHLNEQYNPTPECVFLLNIISKMVLFRMKKCLPHITHCISHLSMLRIFSNSTSDVIRITFFYFYLFEFEFSKPKYSAYFFRR